jgi:aerobic-type carbon monoxide dehydrogenase small subunit (CoxS/CutS family)
MSLFNLKVNGRTHSVDVDPTTPLLYVLSDDLALRGPKFGCGLGQCGACTVVMRGQAVRSCITPVSNVGTIEKPHPLQAAFIDQQAMQCGFCASGVVMTAKAFLDRNPRASEPQIREAMTGVLCRCGTHQRMMNAIKQYAEGLKR